MTYLKKTILGGLLVLATGVIINSIYKVEFVKKEIFYEPPTLLLSDLKNLSKQGGEVSNQKLVFEKHLRIGQAKAEAIKTLKDSGFIIFGILPCDKNIKSKNCEQIILKKTKSSFLSEVTYQVIISFDENKLTLISLKIYNTAI